MEFRKTSEKLERNPLRTLKKFQKSLNTKTEKKDPLDTYFGQSIVEFGTFYKKFPLGFFNINSIAKLQKIEGGGTLWRKKIIRKKSHNAEKTYARYCMLRRKKLGQMI